MALLDSGDFLRCAGGDHQAAVGPRFGAEVDHVVGAFDDLDVVLDNDERVAALHESLKHAEELGDVVEVQAGGGFVEDE